MSGESSVRELRATGLQGVSLGETEIALVDGENGRLIYRGHDAEQLAHESTFEATAFLLWNGRLPDDAELSELRHRAVAGMVVPSEVHDAIRALGAERAADGRPPHRASRSGARCAARAEGGDSEDALWALAATPAIVADYARLRAGEEIARARSRARDRRELPAQAQRRAPEAGAGARARRVLHPRRRARHERLDVHRARDRLDALRPGLGPGRRRRRAQGAAARRRAEPRLAHDRRDRHGRERRALAAPQARGGRGPDGLRPPRLPHLRPARARARRGRRVARGRERAPRARAPRRGDRAAPAGRVQAGPPAVHERRVLRGRRARRRRPAARSLPGDVRRRPHRRLDGAHPRAARSTTA